MIVPKQTISLCIASIVAASSVSVLVAQSSLDRIVTPLPTSDTGVPSLAEAKKALRDVWGELAMQQPNGATYEFFEPLLPPPRYVHADFRFYPLVLSAPRSANKARLISNGSGVNLRGGSRSWKDGGTPVIFRVGSDEFLFGGLVDRVSHPKPLDGWLPIYEITYRHPNPVQAEGLVPIDQKPIAHEPEVYRLEAFVTTAQEFAENAVVFIRFSLASGRKGTITVQTDSATVPKMSEHQWLDAQGDSIVSFDRQWKYEGRGFQAQLTPENSATLAIATVPIKSAIPHMSNETFELHRTATMKTWRENVEAAMQVRVPEKRVDDAWKNLLVQNWQLLQNDKIFYSASNQYEQLYVTEGGDATLALLIWGYEALAKETFIPIIDRRRKGLEHHQAGIKLIDLARFWWITRDREWFATNQSRWKAELARLMTNRDEDLYLLPKGRYCGDVATPIHSLSVEGKAWRALRLWSTILDELGEVQLADQIRKYESDLRSKLMATLSKSIRHETNPPFIPNALLDREEAHTPITATRIGSYWNLMTGFFIESRLFERGSEQEMWLPNYLESHGGLCMGMVRSGGTSHAFWTGAERTNPLYGTRYVLDTLRRDDVDRALVSFYGMLAHGFTRETLIAGEGCTLDPVDGHGRFFYCPPNSAGNAHFLTMLRNLLVQDWDLDDDGRPETLRICSATPRNWLDDGKTIEVANAPTSFGKVSFSARSLLRQGRVEFDIQLPDRNQPSSIVVRPRLPDEWRISRAEMDQRSLPISSDSSVDVSTEKGQIRITFECERIR